MRFLISLLLLTTAVFGQTLSAKKSGTNYVVQATAPTGTPLTLQASDNMHLWVDIDEDFQDPVSSLLDDAGTSGKFVSKRFFRLTNSAPAAPPIRILLVGDSMTADCCGWGPGLNQYFKPNVTFINYSQPWTSTRLFLQSAENDKMQLLKPDYVLMQFAYSECCGNPDISTTLDEFEGNLRTIVQTVRSWNGVPILITLHAARFWDDQGKLIPSRHPYDARTMKVAAELKTPLIDLYPTTFEMFSEMGKAGVEFMKWPPQPEDGMHMSSLGAIYVGQRVVHLFPDELAPYLTGIFEHPPKP